MKTERGKRRERLLRHVKAWSKGYLHSPRLGSALLNVEQVWSRDVVGVAEGLALGLIRNR